MKASLALGSWGLGDRRYAIRQCVAEGIIGPTPAYRPVTGSVMVWTMNKVDDYLAAHGAYQRPPGDPLGRRTEVAHTVPAGHAPGEHHPICCVTSS